MYSRIIYLSRGSKPCSIFPNYAPLKALVNHVAINALTVQFAEKELKIKSCFTVSNPHFTLNVS